MIAPSSVSWSCDIQWQWRDGLQQAALQPSSSEPVQTDVMHSRARRLPAQEAEHLVVQHQRGLAAAAGHEQDIGCGAVANVAVGTMRSPPVTVMGSSDFHTTWPGQLLELP